VRRLTLTLSTADGHTRQTSVQIEQVLLAGYTGRDRARVTDHVRELAALGVPPPERVPAVYVVGPERLTTASEVAVHGSRTSGEAEFYLVPTPRGVLVGAGSDHTDRAHEAVDVEEAKARCPKPISRAVWRYADVRGHWDDLELRSWVSDAEGRRLYQEGRLEALLPVDDLLAELATAGYPPHHQRIIFGGTLPTTGGLVYGHRFEVELYDPVLGRRLGCAYDVVQASGPEPRPQPGSAPGSEASPEPGPATLPPVADPPPP
jgi:hypothetical protein